MPQIKKSYNEVIIPFSKMSFTPDVPASALTAMEYNAGENVETDVRGIRSVNGDTEILSSISGTPTYISGGFRQSGEWYYIVATNEGLWWMIDQTNSWTDITPVVGSGFDGSQYSQDINITEAWNGTVPIYNDTFNPPFFLPDEPGAVLVMYKNIVPHDISNIAFVNATTQQITVSTPYVTAPFGAGEKIVISNVNQFFNGTFEVVSSTTTTIDYLAVPGGAYSSGGQVAANYTWNYNPNWTSLTAGFVRIYSTPNVGNILVAGNLVATDLTATELKFPVTVRWSQNFGTSEVPLTWEPTTLNVANEFEVPLRGEVLDAFPANGQLYLSSYWDTCVLSPLNYTTTSAPILGVRLYNQGRGLLSANCWANTDNVVYGIDARDIWMFNGSTFTGIGNQRVRHWFFDQLDPEYIDRVYMATNTEKNQIEIYYPDKDAPAGGVPNKMLAYRYDLDCWNAPRDVNKATYACESPTWQFDVGTSTWTYNRASRTITYARGAAGSKIIEKDAGYLFINDLAINSSFRRDNIKMLPNYSGKLLVHRILPEVVNMKDDGIAIDPAINPELIGAIDITIEGANSVGQTPQSSTGIQLYTNTDYPWAQINQNAFRINSIEITNDVLTPGTIWMVNAITWQFSETEDDR